MSEIPTTGLNVTSILKHGALAVALLFATGLLQHVKMHEVSLFYFLSTALAIAIGFVHVKMLQKWRLAGQLINFQSSLVFTVVIVLISGLLTGMYYYFVGLNPHFLTSQLSFVLPFLIDQSFRFYLSIPPDKYQFWYYPSDEQIPILDMIKESETQIMHFVLNKTSSTKRATSFKIEAPVNMPLGQVFFNLIYNYNKTTESEPIEYTATNSESFGWLFFTTGGMFKKKHVVDPDLSLSENGIQPGSFIHAIREVDSGAEYAQVNVPDIKAKKVATESAQV